MWLLQIVLAQQVLAVIIAIRCANDRMHMVAGRCLWHIQCHGRLLIVFNQNDWRVDPIVENGLLTCTAHPGQEGVIPVFQDLGELDVVVAGSHATGVYA